jgi:hypothetical protein
MFVKKKMCIINILVFIKLHKVFVFEKKEIEIDIKKDILSDHNECELNV